VARVDQLSRVLPRQTARVATTEVPPPPPGPKSFLWTAGFPPQSYSNTPSWLNKWASSGRRTDLFVRDRRRINAHHPGSQRVDWITAASTTDSWTPMCFGPPTSMIDHPDPSPPTAAAHITNANAIGTGVADDKSILPYVPEMIRFYPCPAPSSATGTLDSRRKRTKGLSARPPNRASSSKEVHGRRASIAIGTAATRCEIDLFRKKIIASPERNIAQPRLPVSTCPDLCRRNLAPATSIYAPSCSPAEIFTSSPAASPASPPCGDGCFVNSPKAAAPRTRGCWKLLDAQSVPRSLVLDVALHRRGGSLARLVDAQLSNVPYPMPAPP